MEDLEAVFRDEEGGYRFLTKKEAVAALEEQTGCKQAACYSALASEGKFRDRLKSKNGQFTLK